MSPEARAELLKMMGDEGMRRFVGVYMSESRRRLQELAEGAAAGDGQRVRDAVHALIPTSRWVGATEVADLCEQLHALPDLANFGPQHSDLVRRITQLHGDWERQARRGLHDTSSPFRGMGAPTGPHPH